jgi:hypothetical protein
MAKTVKTPNPFDSDLHSIVQLAAAFFFIMTVVSVLSGPPRDASLGAGLQYTLTLLSWSGASIVAACIGLAITAKAMRGTKRKQKTSPSKEVLWYLVGYSVVLTLPLTLTILILRA